MIDTRRYGRCVREPKCQEPEIPTTREGAKADLPPSQAVSSGTEPQLTHRLVASLCTVLSERERCPVVLIESGVVRVISWHVVKHNSQKA